MEGNICVYKFRFHAIVMCMCVCLGSGSAFDMNSTFFGKWLFVLSHTLNSAIQSVDHSLLFYVVLYRLL